MATVVMPWIARDVYPAEGLWLVYIFPPVRMLELVVGVVVALEVRNRTWPRLPPLAVGGFAALMYLAAGEAGLWRVDLLPVWAGYAAFTVLPIALVIGAAAYADIDGRRTFLSRRPLVVLGEWSYAFYLLHLLVMFAYGKLTGRPFLGSEWAIVVMLGLLAASVAAAALLHATVERPFERRLRHAPARPPSLEAPL